MGGAIGAVNGILVSKANVAPFVATLGSQSICRGACYVLTSGYFVAGLTDAYTNIGRGSLLGVPNKILVSITIMLLLALLSRRFRPLRSMFYVGGNRQAAFISGIPSGLTIILGYMISGLMAGIAAILMTSSLGMGHAGYGISFEMKAISAAVIGGADMHGGAGSFLGTALGVILVALVNNVFIMFNGSPNWSSAISGLMLLAAVAFDALRRRRKPR
ncbi:ABC transporter permease [Enterocloster bolteae]|uniref:ABC transporter permease n=1 Tax=Enterocloster bolteae TaxID=208479 RepID=UPI001FA8EFBD|nr:ABC transporter permease [Enterocloster bolteae]